MKAGFHAGSLMEEVGKELEGAGGGHDGAAGLSGVGDVEAVLNICLEKAISVLKKL